jgi:hypothetical protein
MAQRECGRVTDTRQKLILRVFFSFVWCRRIWDATTGQCLKTIEDEQNAPMYVPLPSSTTFLARTVSFCLGFLGYCTYALYASLLIHPRPLSFHHAHFLAGVTARQLTRLIHPKRAIHNLILPLQHHQNMELPYLESHEDVYGPSRREVCKWGVFDGSEGCRVFGRGERAGRR